MERCLRLLKKGGSMGMVLTEGVLNNKNLDTVREYFEGRAKLILICSIPQDVFMAAGATVKPSLVFMRKFTAEEEVEYDKCKKEAAIEITALHQTEIRGCFHGKRAANARRTEKMALWAERVEACRSSERTGKDWCKEKVNRENRHGAY